MTCLITDKQRSPSSSRSCIFRYFDKRRTDSACRPIRALTGLQSLVAIDLKWVEVCPRFNPRPDIAIVRVRVCRRVQAGGRQKYCFKKFASCFLFQTVINCCSQLCQTSKITLVFRIRRTLFAWSVAWVWCVYEGPVFWSALPVYILQGWPDS